ncbi:flagellin [Algirhabdus cladophorae]|uniref:flagellin n=1 Tax=Algirhabdus cladophorae TaxID=3377108 RepID=UPI003B845929
MSFTSIGDLAQSLQLRQFNTALKTQTKTLASELATGQHQNLTKHLGGNLRILAGLESTIDTLGSYTRNADQAGRILEDTQTALNAVQSAVSDASSELLSTKNAANASLLDTTAEAVKIRLDTALAALNTRSAGQSLFSGIAIDAKAVPSGEDLLDLVRADMVGVTTVGDAVAALNTFFDDPAGGFATLAYGGDAQIRGDMQISDDQFIEVGQTALDPVITNALKGLVAGALIADAIPDGTVETKTVYMDLAVQTTLNGAADLSTLRGRIGLQEGLVSDLKTRHSAELTTLEISRNELVSVDAYETATRLENTQIQLETLYAVTARLSSLKLADFLR